jgi:uncharacterized protein (DUF1501 family)
MSEPIAFHEEISSTRGASVELGCAGLGAPSGDRHGFLRLAGTSVGLLSLASLARSREAPRPARAEPIAGLPRLVVLNLKGGNDGLNTLVPVGLETYRRRRPRLAIPPERALSLEDAPRGAATGEYRLHPALPRVRDLWAEGGVAAVQKVGYPEPDFSHKASEDIWSLGVRNLSSEAAASGWVARVGDALSLLPGATPVDVVGVGLSTRKDFVGGRSAPLTVDGLSRFGLESDDDPGGEGIVRLATIRDKLLAVSRAGLADEVRRANERAHRLAGEVRAAVAAFTGTAAFPGTPIGRRMRDVATLVLGGFATRLFYTGFGGFDTHSDQVEVGDATGGDHAALLAQLDGAVGAFADQLKAAGVWRDTAIVVITEFGRGNAENDALGTDHGHGSSVLVIGGAVAGGVRGPALSEADLEQEFIPAGVDFRRVYARLLADHVGLPDAPSIFPEPTPLAGDPGDLVSPS